MKISRTLSLRARRAFGVAAVYAIVAGIAGVRSAWSHPLHTTLTEIAIDSADGAMRLTIRAFADDFSAAVSKHAGKPRPADYRVADNDIVAYLASAVAVEDASGKRAPATWGGLRRAGDVVWVTIRIPSIRSLRGVKLVSAVLFDLYDDQVNIVQTSAGGRHRSMLFTAGDGRKLKSLD